MAPVARVTITWAIGAAACSLTRCDDGVRGRGRPREAHLVPAPTADRAQPTPIWRSTLPMSW